MLPNDDASEQREMVIFKRKYVKRLGPRNGNAFGSYGPYTSSVDDNSGFALKSYLDIFRRRRAIVLQTFLLVLAAGTIVTLMTRPVYHASAKLLVDPPTYDINSVDTANPLSSLFASEPQQSVDTQVEVLQSSPLIEQVVKQVGPAALTVSNIGDTNVIEVSAEANSARVAADAPNTLLNLYINQIVDLDENELRSASEFVLSEGQKAHLRLIKAEDALMDFKRKNHLLDISTDRANEIQKVRSLADATMQDSVQMDTLMSQLNVSRALLAQEPASISVPLRVVNPHFDEVREDIAKLEEQRLAETQPGGFTANAPQIKQLDAQIADLKNRAHAIPLYNTTLASDVNTERQSLHDHIVDLQSQIPALQAKIKAEKSALNLVKTQSGYYPDFEVTEARLMRERDNAANEDKIFTDKESDLELRLRAHHAPARIIEAAQVPHYPIRPKKASGILFSVVLGLFLGACFALLQELLDDRINSTADSERLLKLPSLGQIPSLSIEDAGILAMLEDIHPEAESYRILRANIRFASLDRPLRTLMIGSSISGEGKTTTTTNLAFALAMDGKRVVIVDTDLRRPSIHKRFNISEGAGLSDVLLDRISLDAALVPIPRIPTLSLLMCGPQPPNPSEVLGSARFRELLEDLKARFDIVVLDSSPALVASDAAVLAAQVDGVVMVVEPGETKKAAALETRQIFMRARARVIGVAYNKVRSTYGDKSYYLSYRTVPSREVPKLGSPGTNGTGKSGDDREAIVK